MLVGTLTEGEYYDSANNALKGIASKFKLFNISLTLDGEDFEPAGYLTVRIPVPDDYDKSKVKVYGISDDGEKTLYQSVYKDGYLEFKTMEHGIYALVEVSTSKGPQTGEQSDLLLLFVLAMALSAPFLALYKRKKAV